MRPSHTGQRPENRAGKIAFTCAPTRIGGYGGAGGTTASCPGSCQLQLVDRFFGDAVVLDLGFDEAGEHLVGVRLGGIDGQVP